MITRYSWIQRFANRTVLLGLMALSSSQAVFAQGSYKTIGPAGCGVGQNNCHAGEQGKMIEKHKKSVDRILDNDDARNYAELSGIGAANYLKGSSRCMECHGTIISGGESREVEEGVSCESCHGPGSGYKDAHQEGKYSAGTLRPGYTKSLPLGLKDIKQNIDARAKVCVGCHYVTDQKIIAAGHSSGRGFKYKVEMKTVANHWRHPMTAEDQNPKPFEDALKKRGPVVATAAPERARQDAERPVRKPPPPPRAPSAELTAVPEAAKEPIVLPPFPTISDTTQIDRKLLLLKQRLELLYKKTGN